jgi:hypothetical protein
MYDFDLCQGGTSFDSVLAVYDFCPVFKAGEWSQPQACNDDAPVGGCPVWPAGGASAITGLPMLSGENLLIRVAQQGVGIGGQYTLTITQHPLATGTCCLPWSFGHPQACSILSQIDCQALAGSFAGAGTVCGGSNPVVCCPSNFNGNDGVTVQDIFDYLFAWTERDPAADFNHLDGVTVQDIFDFLAAWSDGCQG